MRSAGQASASDAQDSPLLRVLQTSPAHGAQPLPHRRALRRLEEDPDQLAASSGGAAARHGGARRPVAPSLPDQIPHRRQQASLVGLAHHPTPTATTQRAFMLECYRRIANRRRYRVLPDKYRRRLGFYFPAATALWSAHAQTRVSIYDGRCGGRDIGAISVGRRETRDARLCGLRAHPHARLHQAAEWAQRREDQMGVGPRHRARGGS